MSKVIDISNKKFSNGCVGVQVIYNPGSPLALMEIKWWEEVQRFRIDFGKLIAIDECDVDRDELRDFILQELAPRIER